MVKSDKSLTDILADLVAFQTVSGDHVSANDCLNYIRSFLGQDCMAVMLPKNGEFTSLVATTQADKQPKIILQAHLDVVPASADLFNLTEKSGRLYGRGVYDMKFAGAVFLKLVDDLRDELDSYDFGIMFTFDEEIGGEHGVKALLEAGHSGEVCLLPDGGDNWQIQSMHKGVAILRLSTRGVAAHGSRPWDGDNAIHRLIDALHEISQLFKGQNTETDSLSINQIGGGRAMNQVADAAEAVLDIRYIDNKLYDDLSRKITDIAQKYKLEVVVEASVRCVETDMQDSHVKAFLQVAQKIHGQPLGTVCSLGASDAHYFDKAGIPTILLRPDGGSPHSDNEWIDKASLEKYYQLIKAYIQQEARL